LKGATGSKATVRNVGVYVNDSVMLTQHWLLQGGLRYDRFEVKQLDKTGGTELSTTNGAMSGRVGLTYKPVENGSIYASYSQAAQPSAIGASTNDQIFGAKSTIDYEPAVSKTIELGSKWDLANGDVSLTGAIFQTELSDSWEYGSGTDVVRALAAKRLRGIELGVNGKLTDKWSASTGFTAMKSRITKGANEGEEAKNVPDFAFNIWTTYAATEQLSVSYGAQYVGKRRYTDNRYVGGLNNNSSSVNGPNGVHPIWTKDQEKVPAYWLHSMSARYKVNKTLTLGFNVENLFNKFYYSRVGASLDGFQLYGVPGAGRTLSMTADWHF
jgi:catecholate siderophore receptor